MGRCPAEVSLGTVLVDGELQASDGVLGIFLFVDLVGIHQGVRCVVGFFQVVDLDLAGLLESPARLGIRLLHLEGIAGLDVQIRCSLVLVLAATKEGEATTGPLERLVGLEIG